MNLESYNLGIKRLARIIIVAVRCAGGKLTRGEITKAFAPNDWKPTRGELSDAAMYLESRGLIERQPGPSGYFDFSDCVYLAK